MQGKEGGIIRGIMNPIHNASSPQSERLCIRFTLCHPFKLPLIRPDFCVALLMRSKAYLALDLLDEAGKDCMSGLRLDPGKSYGSAIGVTLDQGKSYGGAIGVIFDPGKS